MAFKSIKMDITRDNLVILFNYLDLKSQYNLAQANRAFYWFWLTSDRIDRPEYTFGRKVYKPRYYIDYFTYPALAKVDDIIITSNPDLPWPSILSFRMKRGGPLSFLSVNSKEEALILSKHANNDAKLEIRWAENPILVNLCRASPNFEALYSYRCAFDDDDGCVRVSRINTLLDINGSSYCNEPYDLTGVDACGIQTLDIVSQIEFKKGVCLPGISFLAIEDGDLDPLYMCPNLRVLRLFNVSYYVGENPALPRLKGLKKLKIVDRNDFIVKILKALDNEGKMDEVNIRLTYNDVMPYCEPSFKKIRVGKLYLSRGGPKYSFGGSKSWFIYDELILPAN